MIETVDHPEHYQAGHAETIYVIRDALSREAFEGFLVGNIIKYMARYKHKGGLEDLYKAQWYLDFVIGTVRDRQGGEVMRACGLDGTTER